MAKQTINTLKNWFKTGLKPTQAQFWDFFDSFFHKDDKVPVASVDGLQQELDKKVDKGLIQISDVENLEETLESIQTGGGDLTGYMKESEFVGAGATKKVASSDADGSGNNIATTYATKSESNAKISSTEKGASGGVATLDVDQKIQQTVPVSKLSGVIDSSNLPAFVDDVLEVQWWRSGSGFIGVTPEQYDLIYDMSANILYVYDSGTWVEITANAGIIYVCVDVEPVEGVSTNMTFRWSGTVMISLSNPIDFTTQPEAEAGLNDTKAMSSLRVLQAFMYHVINRTFDGFATTAKTIQGAINELSVKEIAITKYGINGNVYPTSYPVDKSRTITGYRLSANCTDFSITIGASSYTKANITNVVVGAGVELVVNDLTIVAGQNVANAVLTYK